MLSNCRIFSELENFFEVVLESIMQFFCSGAENYSKSLVIPTHIVHILNKCPHVL